MFGYKQTIEERDELLRISLAAKDEVLKSKDQIIEAYIDRGDRYANHNSHLEAELLKVYGLLAKMLEQKDDGSEFKKLLEKALECRSVK